MAINVNSKQEAFRLVEEITGCDLNKDECLTRRSGYDVYKCLIDNNIQYINDLGSCLEIVYIDGTSKNIWIKKCSDKSEEINSSTPKNIKEKLTNKIYELIDKEEYDNIYKLLELISDYKDIIE